MHARNTTRAQSCETNFRPVGHCRALKSSSSSTFNRCYKHLSHTPPLYLMSRQYSQHAYSNARNHVCTRVPCSAVHLKAGVPGSQSLSLSLPLYPSPLPVAFVSAPTVPSAPVSPLSSSRGERRSRDRISSCLRAENGFVLTALLYRVGGCQERIPSFQHLNVSYYVGGTAGRRTRTKHSFCENEIARVLKVIDVQRAYGLEAIPGTFVDLIKVTMPKLPLITCQSVSTKQKAASDKSRGCR
ncbi:hypothetical protein TcWFU_008729 [Taenia crassiceps]|uniref:Uncharacterized protein n=1 Tax=Taenia crassiceps TaxID=6207 RepID=A0ABR4QEZ3_9CEST